MLGSITDVAGIEVGHARDLTTWTGCTIVLCRPSAVVAVSVRGSAPGTRETDLCRPGTLVEHADGILLTGGSAFGLEAATGVVRWLREQGIGFDTGIARVPIVPGAVIFDLAVGVPAWPDARMGYDACASASGGPVAQGCVGAGTGASVGKVLGMDRATKSGLGTASVRVGDVTVAALVVVNAFGEVVGPNGSILAGPRDPATGQWIETERVLLESAAKGAPGNTTIGVIATDASLRDTQARYLAEVAHDGLARSIKPVHTMLDGDAIFALATGRTARSIDVPQLMGLHVAAVTAMEQAVRNAVTFATPGAGLPAAGSAL
jgi:L-aminopeptidase/D-esterase-like protein